MTLPARWAYLALIRLTLVEAPFDTRMAAPILQTEPLTRVGRSSFIAYILLSTGMKESYDGRKKRFMPYTTIIFSKARSVNERLTIKSQV